MDLEVVRAKLVADANAFVAEMHRAQGVMGVKLPEAAAKANGGISKLKGGLVSLAVHATGVSGSVGKIAQGLLIMGGGSTAVLGVAAAIGALSIAINFLTSDAKKNTEAMKAMIAELDKLGTHAQATSLRIQIAALESSKTPSFLRRLIFAGTGFGGGPERLEVINREIAKLQGLLGKNLGDAVNERVADFKELERVLFDINDTLKGFVPPSAQDMEDAIFGPADAKNAQTMFDESADREAWLADLKHKRARRNIIDPDTEMALTGSLQLQDIKQFGVQLGQELIVGMAEGMENMQDFLKSVFMQLLNFVSGRILGAVLGTAIGGPAGGVAGALSGGKVLDAVKSPASMSVGVSMGGVQPVTAFFVARDPAFQQILREGIIVAGQQGFSR